MNIIHPAYASFIVALPIVALFAQVTYMINKEIAYSKSSLRIIGLAFLVSFLTIISGMNEAEHIFKNNLILQDGIEALKTHKIFGIILVFLLFITSIFKWNAISKKSFFLEKISLIMIIITLLFSLYQGRSGGEIVYKYSGNIDNKIIKQRFKELKN